MKTITKLSIPIEFHQSLKAHIGFVRVFKVWVQKILMKSFENV